MKRKFWHFIHDKLEQAWHWVYYHKLTEPSPIDIGHVGYQYTYSYVCGKTGMMTAPTPVPSANDLDVVAEEERIKQATEGKK